MHANPYFRAFLISFGLFLGTVWRSWQRYEDLSSRRGVLLMLTLGTVMIIATGLVGTFSRRSAKPWSWPKTALLTFVCWMGIFGVMAILVSVEAKLNH